MDWAQGRVEQIRLPASLAATGEGRHFVADFCRREGVGPRTADDAVLLTSELLTNAFMHARSPAELTIHLVDGALRIEVSDTSAAPPVPRHPGPARPGGRGMLLVEAIAARWGILAEVAGKTIWFELDRA